ncbi:hypothetical protein [Luteolibacter luteus]|uniref:Uncharacterized protein n=1 Tax=Luteolibacter luteus TaxID=2728835 RepID=A0A858REJ3_9BACT|nr:hypothetical protein [Luteolibacter luteus]QJE95247.1 hypothetical protein HHL09_05475 [Luteolibacter luteus]
MPAAPKKKSGCLRLLLIITGCSLGALILMAVIGALVSPSPQTEQGPATPVTRPEKRPPATVQAPAESPPAPSLPEQVEELARKEFGDRFERVFVTQDTTGTWNIIINVFDENPGAASLQRSIIRLAALCHPEGLKVGQFEVAAWSNFVDGLGNVERKGLVRAHLRPEVAPKVNWKNEVMIEFHAAFATEFVHPAFKQKWADSDIL